jgi:uncharacterized protein (TIGR00251 family)
VSEAVLVAVRVTPRSGRDAIDGVDEAGALRLRVTAPPAAGAANQAAVRLVAGTLRLPRGAVTVVRGRAARSKRLRVTGVDAASLRARWPGLSVSAG